MPTVRYDDRSFIVDDRRIWLCSGSIHYFRVPRDLWRDRLLKARRAGLNCVQTYAAWNVHEPQTGEWNFEGEADVREFVLQAQAMGLYVILRPGPYICAEWDFGGFPPWLATKSGVAYRTSNATYMHYFDKYLGQLLPRLSDLQVVHGGNLVLVQNENEYVYTVMPDRINYGQFINQLIRRDGFEVPIITCNLLSEPRVPDTIECFNNWGREVQGLKRLRSAQPEAPLLATEFWPGWFDWWGGDHHTKPAREVARRALEVLGCGCQINYYMWHGGTNFGFWGSQVDVHDWSHQTTSYDYDAPLAEGGGLTEKYYLTKPVNMLATHFGHVFAQARMTGPDVTVHSGTEVLNLAGKGGRIAVVTANGREGVEDATVSLPDGTELEVALAPLGATAVPAEVRLGPEAVLDYANLMPLGVFGEGHLLLHGPPGWEGRININGKEVRVAVPERPDPVLLEHQGQRVAVINTDLAMRTWEVEGTLVMGPDFVGETLEEVTPAAGSRQYAILTPEGELTHKKVKPSPRRRPTPPRLRSFERVCVCEEPIDEELTWEKLDHPRDLAALEIAHGYGWYRAQVEAPRAVRRHLFCPECEDRAAVYVNGKRAGLWGRGPGARRECLNVGFRRGVNNLVFLVDNLGRHNVGAKLGAHKGLFGHVWEAKPLRLKKFKVVEGGDFSRRMVPRQMTHLLAELEAGRLWTAEVAFNLPKIHPVHLSYTELPYHAIVLCNDRQAAFLPRAGGYGDVTLGNELKRGKNRLKLLLWGDVQARDLERVKLHLLTESVTAKAKWSYRRWAPPAGEGGRVVGKGLPAWYRCRFKYKPQPEPLFLRVLAAKKGQIYLNGHDVGRFWTVGPQELYYLPEPWLADENELLLFEEEGNIPSGSRVEFHAAGPYR